MIRWEEGRCVVFDDTYRHEVWNDSDEVRAVLLIDVHRPFRPWAARVNRMILRLFRLTPFVRDAIRKHKAWEDSFFDAGRVAPKKAA
jgi:ornithine lipid ester-linked acyl 2-hydroxylase